MFGLFNGLERIKCVHNGCKTFLFDFSRMINVIPSNIRKSTGSHIFEKQWVNFMELFCHETVVNCCANRHALEDLWLFEGIKGVVAPCANWVAPSPKYCLVQGHTAFRSKYRIDLNCSPLPNRRPPPYFFSERRRKGRKRKRRRKIKQQRQQQRNSFNESIDELINQSVDHSFDIRSLTHLSTWSCLSLARIL